MATERLSMRTIREILRQRWALGRPHRAVAASVGRSVGTIHATEQRATAAGLTWPSLRKGGGRVDAPGSGVVEAEGNSPL